MLSNNIRPATYRISFKQSKMGRQTRNTIRMKWLNWRGFNNEHHLRNMSEDHSKGACVDVRVLETCMKCGRYLILVMMMMMTLRYYTKRSELDYCLAVVSSADRIIVRDRH